MKPDWFSDQHVEEGSGIYAEYYTQCNFVQLETQQEVKVCSTNKWPDSGGRYGVGENEKLLGEGS